MGAAEVAVLLEVDCIFTRKEQKTASKAFLDGKDVFVVLPTGCGKKTLRYNLATELMLSLTPTGSPELQLPGSAGFKKKKV